MNDWFNGIRAASELSAAALRDLHDDGFVVIPGPLKPADLPRLAAAHDSAVNSAISDDRHTGSTTTRVSDFVNRGPEFDSIYIYPPVLEACCHIIGRPFKLSTMHARTVRPCSPAQDLHVDFKHDLDGWPMVGFILMIDEFRPDNGATRFVPGSHKWSATQGELLTSAISDNNAGEVLACGPAGSMIVFNGSVWHGHAANSTGVPRRSIQGAYIRREAHSGANLPARMQPETIARISPLAKYLIGV